MDIIRADSRRAPIVVIYGAEGRGKTTLASRFTNPLFLLLEQGLPRGVTVDAINGVKTFADVMTALRQIYQDTQHTYGTLVVDTIDRLEGMIHEHVCAENRWTSIETPGFGKGWVFADTPWRQFIRAVSALRDDCNMTIVLVAHSDIARVEDPRAPSFTAYGLRLHRRARALVMDVADIVGFLADDLRVMTESGGFRERTRAAASPARFLFLEGTPAFAAKNRYAMPAKIDIPRDFNVSTFLQHAQPQEK
jgi:AAA domain